MATPLEIVSYNVKGLCSQHKRGQLWHELQYYAADITFLQETHFRERSTPNMPGHMFSHWYHVRSPIARARGVTIAIKKTCPWVLTTVQADREGRFLFVKGVIHGQQYTIAAIYAPNMGTVKFLAETLRALEKFKEGCLILGGDLNMVLDPGLDTTSGKTSISFRALKYLKQLLRTQHLVDSWRVLHNEVKDYSYYSKVHKMYSRIDVFMVDQFYLENVRNCTIEAITISDHAPITLTLSPIKAGYIERTWRLNESLLDNKRITE